MTDALTTLIGGLRQLNAEVTAEELSEVLWLWQQSPRWGGLPAPVLDATAAAVRPHWAGPPDQPDVTDGGHAQSPRRRPRDDPSRREPETAWAAGAGQLADTAEPTERAARVRLPDAPALPQARKLSRTLRPLRYDPRRIYPADGIEEEATALRTAQAGIRIPVQRTTRRRRFDLDLVLDVGGSGLLWTRLATELRTMLELNGAFRGVRFWLLDSDSAKLSLLPGHGGTTGYPPSAICQAPRRPLVIVLTDGTGRSWQTLDAYRPLRAWTTYGTVLLAQLLPTDMWNRTALRALPVAFHPASDGYHRGDRIGVRDVDLSIIELDRSRLRSARAVPVIGLDAHWLRSWLPLLRGSEAGTVPGYALLVPAPGREGGGPDQASTTALPEEELTGEERVQRFMLTASRDARTLARLLSVGTPTLPGMRKIRYELLPDSEPQILAEVMLGGLMYWTPTTVAEVLAGQTTFDFYPDVQDLLRERPGGEAELARDRELVTRALWSAADTGSGYSGIAVVPDVTGKLVPIREDKLSLLPPYPVTAAPAASSRRPSYSALYDDGEVEAAEPGARPVQIGIWGSNQSGRTTYLTILGMLGMGLLEDEPAWVSWRRGEQWRLVPVGDTTKAFVVSRANDLIVDREFPSTSIRNKPTRLSFRLEKRRPKGSGLMRWLQPERVARITVAMEDRAGIDFSPDDMFKGSARYLTSSDVLVYFYDPTYDGLAGKFRSFDFFDAMATELGRASRGRLYQGFLPQHIAVCLPKLDDQVVFNTARLYGCAETDQRTGLPWVPPRHARRLFETITYDQNTIDADFLRRGIGNAFHPKRVSYHALSSVGFWVPARGDTRLDPSDVCNLRQPPYISPRAGVGPPRPRLRGEIRPVHVLDPLISLVERASKRADRR